MKTYRILFITTLAALAIAATSCKNKDYRDGEYCAETMTLSNAIEKYDSARAAFGPNIHGWRDFENGFTDRCSKSDTLKFVVELVQMGKEKFAINKAVQFVDALENGSLGIETAPRRLNFLRHLTADVAGDSIMTILENEIDRYIKSKDIETQMKIYSRSIKAYDLGTALRAEAATDSTVAQRLQILKGMYAPQDTMQLMDGFNGKKDTYIVMKPLR